MSENKDCTQCCSYNNEFCKQWKTRVTDTKTAETCNKYGMKKQLNKGLQIRQNKLNKQAEKRAEIKPEQQDIVCFVEFSEKIIEKINGKYRRPKNVIKGHGLQIKNRIILTNGHCKMVNRSTLKITKRYEGIPEWATPKLVALYNQDNVSETVKKPARKRCNTCEHFVYSVNANTKSAGYRCEITGRFTRNYKQLVLCMAPQYKRKSKANLDS